MTCTWCTSDAVAAGERPQGVTGAKYFFACVKEKHQKLLDRLGYDRRDVNEIRMALKREEKEAKKAS